ncbi:MAG: riboflavin synthase [candidate division Zixibacteria bacterium]|nr:riboflavin synthase [candidate division Zixibacteria bacterium]
MFTGFIETVGTLAEVTNRGDYRVLRISVPESFGPLALGESISCDGACLTVTACSLGDFVVEASQETISRTIMADYIAGRAINLERALRADSRMGGHFVTGHVDTVGTIEYFRQVGESWELAVRFDARFDRLVVEKGSVAIDGVSLTVNLCESGVCVVNLIPFTLGATNLSKVKPGVSVNLEFDLLGKYVLKAVGGDVPAGVTMEKLQSSGW